MKTIPHILQLSTSFIFSAFLVLTLAACSDDKKETAHQAFDHEHGSEVTDLVKHKFEHEFAAQCVERELKNSTNIDQDRKRYAKSCMCIATYMMKDLTAKEAEKFLNEKKNPHSLTIRFENAAYHCLQTTKKSQPQAPVIFKQR